MTSCVAKRHQPSTCGPLPGCMFSSAGIVRSVHRWVRFLCRFELVARGPRRSVFSRSSCAVMRNKEVRKKDEQLCVHERANKTTSTASNPPAHTARQQDTQTHSRTRSRTYGSLLPQPEAGTERQPPGSHHAQPDSKHLGILYRQPTGQPAGRATSWNASQQNGRNV
jgi:hypothetical protein